MTTRVLSGITPSGAPHLGNYVGAIRPAIHASLQANTESFYFLADLHSLIKAQDPERTHRSTLEIAAAWLACGLDPTRVHFYRQSDIPEIPQLMWLLSCIAAKGTLNRAHAYKAAVELNRASQEEDDHGITMGLYMYPILMAADILLFNPHKIPVGRDQIQHVEIARDFAQRFNHTYKTESFILPQAAIEEHVAVLPGLDGRKMSKSYGNTIPLFAPPQILKQLVFSIVTDSRAPGESKNTENSALFELFKAFADPEQTREMAEAFSNGISWAEAKHAVFLKIDAEIAPLREKYSEQLAHPQVIEEQLRHGAAQLRERLVIPMFSRLRSLVGIRDLSKYQDCQKTLQAPAKQEMPVFKQYREKDQKFYFKLLSTSGQLLLQSEGFSSPQEAGRVVAQLKRVSTVDSILPYLVADIDPQRVLEALSVWH